MTTKNVLLLHSRDFQPMKPDLERLWLDTLEKGVERHRPDALPAWKAASAKLVYFGNILTGFYATVHKRAYDPEADVADRRTALEGLLTRSDASKEAYAALPRNDRFLAPALPALSAGPSVFGAIERLPVTLFADVEEYLNRNGYFGTSIRAIVLKAIVKTLESGGPLAIVAHGLGAVAAYEVLWNISHHEQWRGGLDMKRVDFFAVGSPLGDPAFMKRLVGSDRSGRSRTPTLIKNLVTVSATDDLFAFRGDPAGWFKEALDGNHLGSLKSSTILNFSIRNGAANPHHAGGYLLAPELIAPLADWLVA